MRWKTLLEAALVLVVLGASLGLAFWSSPTGDWSEDARVEAELESLRAGNRAMRAENQRLGRLVEALKDDPAVIEQVAREDLGYIRDGEVVVIVPK